MSKQIKQMEMDALRDTFGGVRDFVFLSVTGLNCQEDNQLRLKLRKKDIRLHQVKNSLARRVFDEIGVRIGQGSDCWAGPTTMAWGAGSLAELSRELDAQVKDLVKKNAKLKDRIQFKGAVVEGQPVGFDAALRMPTRAEAIGAIVAAVLGPASQIAGQLVGPASQVASQIQKISEKTEGTPAPAAG